MIGVVGAGSMGSALIDGFLAAGHGASELLVVDRNVHKLERFHDEGVAVSADIEAAAIADYLILAVKPYHVLAVAGLLAGVVKEGVVVISVAAGITTESLEGQMGELAVIRAMPNTPSIVRQGMTGLAGGTHVSAQQLDDASHLLAAVGGVVTVDEADLDVLTAISGSGPAYVFLLAEALEQAAVDEGLERRVAKMLAEQTINGAGQLLAASPDDAAVLRGKVTSPGGTTQAAIESFEQHGFAEMVHAAVRAASERSRQMATQQEQ